MFLFAPLPENDDGNCGVAVTGGSCSANFFTSHCEFAWSSRSLSDEMDESFEKSQAHSSDGTSIRTDGW